MLEGSVNISEQDEDVDERFLEMQQEIKQHGFGAYLENNGQEFADAFNVYRVMHKLLVDEPLDVAKFTQDGEFIKALTLDDKMHMSLYQLINTYLEDNECHPVQTLILPMLLTQQYGKFLDRFPHGAGIDYSKKIESNSTGDQEN